MRSHATIVDMGQFLLLLVVALTVGGVVFGVTVLVSGADAGLSVAEPDGRAMPLPGTRPLMENDVANVRFDLALRGYRMAQVDQALRRTAYDIGYKDELISVLEAEVAALREGRLSDAEVLRRAREAAIGPQQAAVAPAPPAPGPAALVEPVPTGRDEPGQLAEPDEPAEPGGLAEPAGRAEPGDAEPRDESDGPANPAERPGRDEPVEPARPAEPAAPGGRDGAIEPDTLAGPAEESATAAESAERR
jgi:DivIVA domain-containing protein